MQPHHRVLRGHPVRTPTLPPATHTNCWILGRGRLAVVDPASPYVDEQEGLAEALLQLGEMGETVDAIVLTHHHGDHVSGAVDLQRRLREAGQDVPILAHPRTAELLRDLVPVQGHLDDGDVLELGQARFEVLFTPGHAPGHLALHEPEAGLTIAGDLVASVGTIVLAPHEADLQQYLDSLERVRSLGTSLLLPAHGDPIPHAEAVLSFYVAHRHQRSDQIRQALQNAGLAGPADLVDTVYTDLPAPARPLAIGQILTHLRWLARHGLAVESPRGWTPT